MHRPPRVRGPASPSACKCRRRTHVRLRTVEPCASWRHRGICGEGHLIWPASERQYLLRRSLNTHRRSLNIHRWRGERIPRAPKYLRCRSIDTHRHTPRSPVSPLDPHPPSLPSATALAIPLSRLMLCPLKPVRQILELVFSRYPQERANPSGDKVQNQTKALLRPPYCHAKMCS